MTCRELVEFLDSYLDGELVPTEIAEFERHLKVCDACVRYVDSYKRSVVLGRQALASTPDDVPREVPEDLVAAILRARPPR